MTDVEKPKEFKSLQSYLIDGDYILVDEAAWLTVKNFSIRIHSTDEGVNADIYKNGHENQGAIAAAYAFDAEAEEEEDES